MARRYHLWLSFDFCDLLGSFRAGGASIFGPASLSRWVFKRRMTNLIAGAAGRPPAPCGAAPSLRPEPQQQDDGGDTSGSAARSSEEQKEIRQAFTRDAAAPRPALKRDRVGSHVQHPHPQAKILPNLVRTGVIWRHVHSLDGHPETTVEVGRSFSLARSLAQKEAPFRGARSRRQLVSKQLPGRMGA